MGICGFATPSLPFGHTLRLGGMDEVGIQAGRQMPIGACAGSVDTAVRVPAVSYGPRATALMLAQPLNQLKPFDFKVMPRVPADGVEFKN